MPDPAPNAELLRSLGRLTRGLSALFWGLPALLVVTVRAAITHWLAPLAIIPILALNGLLLIGLWQMSSFQKQERPWRAALDRAKLLGLVNLGLSPFIYWWNHVPGELFFGVAVFLLALNSVLFLFNLNLVLARLVAMLPDETLRHETKQYTTFNRGLLLALLLLAALFVGLTELPHLPFQLRLIAMFVQRGSQWVVILLVLLPLAMTMALIWKTKEVILEGVFGGER